jgi:zinc/manganese transport system substrate-binding protein
MRPLPPLALTFALLALLTRAAEAKLSVVATTADLAALAREIGGDRIDLVTLARPTEDPHFVDPKPSFMMKLNRADALIEGGADLEQGWLPPLLTGARNPRLSPGSPGRIICREGIEMLEVPVSLDRAKGDIHGAGNPHYVIDPVNGRIIAGTIARAFCRLDAAGCEAYQANLKRFQERLDAKLTEWQQRLAPFQGRRLVAYHNSWPYFARRFGLRIDLFLEPKPGIPPSAAHLTDIVRQMQEEHVHVILVDAYLNRRTAETVAGNTGATIVEVTQFPGGLKGTEGGYLELLDYLVDALATALARDQAAGKSH